MKTRIICSKAYARAFRSELRKAEFDLVWEKLVHTGKRFYDFYKPRILSILTVIPKYTGFGWDEFAPAEVPIYLVDIDGPSRASPLILKVRDNIEYMLTVLSHELIHINMPGQLFGNELINEDAVNQVTLKVCERVGIEAGTDKIKAYQKAIQEKGFVSRELNLEEKTVKEALNLAAIREIEFSATTRSATREKQ